MGGGEWIYSLLKQSKFEEGVKKKKTNKQTSKES